MTILRIVKLFAKSDASGRNLVESNEEVATVANAFAGQEMTRKFAVVSGLFGLVLALTAIYLYFQTGVAWLIWKNTEARDADLVWFGFALISFLLIGILQTGSAYYVFICSNKPNQTYYNLMMTWMLTTLFTAIALFTCYYGMNYSNYYKFQARFPNPFILHLVICTDFVFLICSEVASLFCFQKTQNLEDAERLEPSISGRNINEDEFWQF